MSRQRQQAKYATSRGERQTQSRLFMLYLLVILAIASIVGGSYWLWKTLHSQELLPIRHVKIEGNLQYLDQDALIAQVAPALTHGFLGVDMQRITRIALAQPWVASVRIHRIWPATIRLTVKEHQPIARWGEHQLLASSGSVLTPKTIAPFMQLPRFDAPAVLAKTLWSEYQHLQVLLSPLQLQITHLSVTPRRSWSIKLNNGMQITLGNENMLARLGRFVTTYPHIANHQHMGNAKVDLRYTNGFAFKPA